jgi:hypothetical protein
MISRNRAELCLQRLAALGLWFATSPSRDCVSITVLDNASEKSYSSVKQLCDASCFRYFKSAANTGFSGNFCRAVVAGDSPYVWVVSDDDYFDVRLIDLVLSLLTPSLVGLIGISQFIDRPYAQGVCTEIIPYQIQYDTRSISALTLVSSVIFMRSNFDFRLFWKKECLWFPHSYSIFATSIARRDEIILIRPSSKIFRESGYTQKERQQHSQSQYVRLLGEQFQSAVLNFLNFLLESCDARTITKEEYIDGIIRSYNCPRSAIESGFNSIPIL